MPHSNMNSSDDARSLDRRCFLGALGGLAATAAWSPAHRIYASSAPAGCPQPPGFPAGIEVYLQAFENWTGEISIDQLWTCTPSGASDLVELMNWAHEVGYALRPRGFKHNWSPLVVTPETNCSTQVVLMDMTSQLSSMSMESAGPPAVRVGAGASMDDLLQFLEDRGYGVTSCPAPGDISIGGVLAIGGHGTGIPSSDESRQIGQTFGSMSNRVLALTAVVWNESSEAYEVRTFDRADPEMTPLLVNLGRVIVTEVVLQVESNVNLRCESYMSISASELFAPAGSGGQTFERFLDESGRVEAIWYPFTQNPWLKVWSVTPNKPFWAREVDNSYNYPFSDNLSGDAVTLINQILDGAPGLTPTFGGLMWTITNLGLTFDGAWDMWGKSKNLLHYIKPSTLRTSANGYAILTRRDNIQTVLNQFAAKYLELMNAYADQGRYPINGPVEIRVTGLERSDEVERSGSRTVGLSALSPREDHPEWDVAVWLDLLTVPGTPDAGPFYRELESWLFAQFGETANSSMRVEWSKGWGYTDAGPWTNEQVINDLVPESFRHGRRALDQWDSMIAQMKAFDPNGVVVNEFLLQLLDENALDDCPGDLNSDGVVDGADLAPLLAGWGATNSAADLNQDGSVDGIDLAELLSSWGLCSP